MKNFPHQYNDLRKLRATLQTVSDLNDAGRDADDDETLGYELARRRVYGFRPRIDETGGEAAIARRIAERLDVERTKQPSNQGTQTAAREMRRTLRYLGWLNEEGTALTPAGEALLGTAEGSDEELVLMQQAIGSIAVEDRDGHVSHPVQILLRLVDEVALDSRSGMQVALEAVDDSAREFRRIARIAALPEDERVEALTAVGWTDSQLANAIKILPAFAEQSGLITTDGVGRFILTDAGRRALGRAGVRTPPEAPPGRRPPRRRRRRPTSISTADPGEVGRSRRLLGAERRVLTPEEQAIAAELLYERTERHQELVRTVAAACRGGEFHEDAAAFDLVIDLDPAEALVLAEVKTVSGDAAAQLRGAVGQLLYYEYFAVAEAFPGRAVRKVVVVDDRVPDELAAFLQANGIGLITYVDGEFVALNELGEEIARDLFG